MPKIFISYRQGDSDATTKRIFDRLAARFGPASVFRDLENVRPGVNFHDVIAEAVDESDVSLVVVGPHWFHVGNERGKRRIDDPFDAVRIEVETALSKDVPVIPILVGGASMPRASDLPSSLEALTYRNALRVGVEEDFDRGIERLISGLEALTAREPPDGGGAALTEPSPPKVFISYSHDSPEHEESVRNFADQLRADGIDATIDQYVMSPPEGWPAWCDTEIRNADFVLLVCTDAYLERISGTEEARQRAPLWEARLIKQSLYDTGSSSGKFVPVLLHDAPLQNLPRPIIGSTVYYVETPDGYESLLRLLTDQPRLILPALGKRRILPPRIRVGQDTTEILAQYVSTRGGPMPLREAKLILVGFGGTGKTSLVRRLVYDAFDPYEPKTEGINITDWSIIINGDEDVDLHIWDFGGQEIMHSTHQFFLTQRSVYLLVLNGRQGREDADADYWLNLIASFGGDSPVIVVLNKVNEHAFDVDRKGLKQKFFGVQKFIETDCADRRGIDSLHEVICDAIDSLPNFRDAFPSTWFAIKDRLARMPENYLSFDQYRAMCAQYGETDIAGQERLAQFLHDLGVCLNYRDDARLRDINILNPHWITDGIYKILNSPLLTRRKGELNLIDLDEILDSNVYPGEKHSFLIELMRKFELCFPFPDLERTYLIPELLDKQEPDEIRGFDNSPCIKFEYQYPTAVPEGLIPRFIVRNYVRSLNQPRWRNGVVLAFEGNRGLIRANPLAKTVQISVDGPKEGRRRLLAVIRNDFDMVHSRFTFEPEGRVPVSDYPGMLIPYKKLLTFEAKKIDQIPEVVGDDVVILPVRDLLDGIDLPRRNPIELVQPRPPLRGFVSYSHKDEILRAELETHLKLLNREGLLEIWNDRCIGAGDEWRGEIDKNMEIADLILLLISADFIASDYCYDREMNLAIGRHDQGAARVIPVIIREVKWDLAPFRKLQALPLNGKPVATWGPDQYARDIAWRNVSDGIAKVLTDLYDRH